MKIRNDDREAFRAGNLKDIAPEVLEVLKAESAPLKPQPKAKEEEKAVEKKD